MEFRGAHETTDRRAVRYYVVHTVLITDTIARHGVDHNFIRVGRTQYVRPDGTQKPPPAAIPHYAPRRVK